MFWVELFIAFLALYLVYSGLSLISHTIRNLWITHKNKGLVNKIGFAGIIISIIAILVILMAFPLGLMLDGQTILDPVFVAIDLFIALLLHKWGATEL